MSRDITCSTCEERGWWYPNSNIGGSIRVPCLNCKDGKIKVYTESEVQELIKQEKEECALICDKLDFVKIGYFVSSAGDCAEAIRRK